MSSNQDWRVMTDIDKTAVFLGWWSATHGWDFETNSGHYESTVHRAWLKGWETAHEQGSFYKESDIDAMQDKIAALEARVEQMRNALIEHNDLLRSAFQIADREGVKQMVATTNWDAFYNRVTVVLKRHHATTNDARALLAKETP